MPCSLFGFRFQDCHSKKLYTFIYFPYTFRCNDVKTSRQEIFHFPLYYLFQILHAGSVLVKKEP